MWGKKLISSVAVISAYIYGRKQSLRYRPEKKNKIGLFLSDLLKLFFSILKVF